MKFQATLALVSEKQTLSELSQKYEVHQTVLQRWKKKLLESRPEIFDQASKPRAGEKQIESLQKKIGQMTMVMDFLKKALGK